MPASAVKAAGRTTKLSRVHKPEDWDVREWQLALRRQFAPDQPFQVRNLGPDPVFSEFAVFNPASARTYRVVIRGEKPSVNFCACPDYAVNTLGTCKHIEHVLHKLRKRAALKLRQGYVPEFAEVYLRYGSQRRVVFSLGAASPPGLLALAKEYFASDGTLMPAAVSRFDKFVAAIGNDGHDVRIYDDALAFVAELRDGAARREKLQALFAGPRGEEAWEKLLKVKLYPYQQTGALFAAVAGRAIIADDMGLGKTIEAIATAEILARHAAAERTLIVCPTTLKYQWLGEIGQFSGRPAKVIEGGTYDRRRLYQDAETFFKIVNYDVVHRDLEAIAAWQPDIVVLDEAQRIKNWQTRAARAVKRIDSRYAIVLTGTPLENRIDELHSIVEFVDRFRLGPLFAFKDAHAEYEGGTSKVIGYRDLNKITQTLAPILIRRTKDQVLKQLPPRMDKNFFVPMTKEQWQPHDESREIVARIVAKWHRYKFLSEADKIRLQMALQCMRMACDNTYLVDHETRHGTKVDELCKLLGEVFEERGAKVVIFSQWTRMHDLIVEMLADQRWGHVYLHGGVPSKQRKDLVRALKEEVDCRVFLSTDAGGVGLNLQAASAVINMDLPWNPAVLEQRIGRVHRLGQGRPVRVVNYISEGTIEHGMLSLLKFKRSVFEGVLDGAADRVFMGEGAMNRFMKTVERAASSIPTIRATPDEDDDGFAMNSDSESDFGDDRALPGRAGILPALAALPAPTTESGPGAAAPGRGAVTIDVATLGAALARGAELLGLLGRQLSDRPPTSGQAPANAGPRIERDASTGRAELRIALPDEQVLQHWVGQLSNVLRGFVR